MGNIYNYMISLKSLLIENPDTIYYKKKTYNYRSPSNKCAFLVYKDEKSDKNAIFGYSFVKKDFYCDDPDVLKDVDELFKQPSIKLDTNKNSENQLDYWGQRAINNLKNGNSGGGHLDIENLLKGIGRFGFYADPLLKGRIFEVDDSDLKIESTIPSGKAIIVTFWDSKRGRIIKYKDQYDKVIEFNGYDPKECLYEPSMNFYTYDNFYNDGPSISEKPLKTTTSNTTDSAPWSTQTGGNSVSFKVGDKVKIKGLNIFGDVLSIQGNNVTLKVTETDMGMVRVGSDLLFPYYGLELDKRTQGELLDKVIDDKTQEFVEKRGKLHSTGATFTPAEKANLEREVDGLEIEIKILNDLLASGEKYYTDNVKSVVATSVQRKLHAKNKEKEDRYSLIKQAEKQYGMPIAQIRQKYRNVPLDQLVKKESLYKKVIKALL